MYFNFVKSLFFFNSIFSLNAGCAKCCPCCRDRDNSTVLNLDRNRYKGKINEDPDKNVKSEKIEDTDKNKDLNENLKTDKNIDENLKSGKTLVNNLKIDKDIDLDLCKNIYFDDNVNDEDLNENVKPGKTLVNNVKIDKDIDLDLCKNIKSEKIEDTDKNIAENLKTDKNIDEDVKIYENIDENVKSYENLVKIEDSDKTIVNNVNTDKNIILYEDIDPRIAFTNIPTKYIKDCYKKVDKNFIPKGLRRKGFSCYFLALMQCFYYLKGFRQYFIDNEENFNVTSYKICKKFSLLMKNMDKNDKEYSHLSLLNTLSRENSLFNYEEKGADAEDLYRNFINDLTFELQVKKIWYENDLENLSKVVTISSELNEYYQNIVSETLNANYLTIYKCSICKKFNYSSSSDTPIRFVLGNVINYKKLEVKAGLSLKDCFDYEYSRESISYAFCKKCNIERKCIQNNRIALAPKILVISLCRGKGKKFKNKVGLDVILDIEDYLDDDYKRRNKNIKYKIVGVVMHCGASSSSSHYTANCLADNDLYYHFNDDNNPEKIDVENVFTKGGDPYLLFYERIDND